MILFSKVLLYQTQLDELDPRLRGDDGLFAFYCHSRGGGNPEYLENALY